MPFDPSKFVVKEPKSLPLVFLLDVSGSMSYANKIEALNKAVKDMIDEFSHEEIKIIICIITFGYEVKCITYDFLKTNPQAFVEINELQTYLKEFSASGSTPMGTALEMAKAIIEDKNQTPGKAYRPTVILVSDGQPDSGWEKPLEDFIKTGRSQKCDRMAMAIGKDADKNVLQKFVDGTNNPLFEAHNASEIVKFFKLVTMSVTQRTHSSDPNKIPSIIKENADKPIMPSDFSSNDDEDDELF